VSLPSRIFLTGFSGTGKTTVAPMLAERLGWEMIDTDDVIEMTHGRITEIFRQQGEERFREMESDVLNEACSRNNVVIATGGGIILNVDNRCLMSDGGFVVCLESRPDTIFRRMRDRVEEDELDRPLLVSSDPLARIRDLKAARQHLYALCDWTVHTDSLTPEQVVDEILRAREAFGVAAQADEYRLDDVAISMPAPVRTLHAIPEGAAAMVRTTSGDYPVFVEWGSLAGLSERLKDSGIARQVYVISDEQVWHHLGDEVEAALTGAEIPFESFVVAPGEATKSLETAKEIYDWLIEHRAERGHAVVAVGGGMITDLGGYVAATFARGLPLVHLPTSVLAMVDASIGGKVAVNHPRAKNMIGAFYQPRMVIADPAVLRTLPAREHSGWAEAIKHAMIADEEYLRFFEEKAEAVMKLERDAMTEAISRSVAIKAGVVSADEKETSGLRTTLNYGHTLAHAIESTTGYQRFRHGEADAIGMMAAAEISARMGLLEADVVERQRAVLERFGLPTSADGLDRGALLAAIALDKKVEAKKVRWVLLQRVGSPVVRDDVPAEVVEAALDTVLR
jgi:shikimate kinase/3-dehydroquinate synthase